MALLYEDGAKVELSEEVAVAVGEFIDLLGSGSAVTFGRLNTTLTTQEAADLLSISRPTLVRLLNEGRIPFTQPGVHRRVALNDILAFRDQLKTQRRDALAELTRLTNADGFRADPFVSTR